MRKLSLALACATILGTSNAFAMGMGELQVRSFLNQPLRAEIPITDLRAGEAEQLKVRFADEALFERAGLSRGAVAGRVQLQVQGGPRPRVLLTSDRPIRDPALGLILQVDGPDGSMAFEYSILLDPVGYQPVRLPAATRHEDVRPAPLVESPVARKELVQSAGLARGTLADGSYRVADGDTLWSITQRVLPEGVTMQQAMAGIRQANRQAFANPDSNDALLAGSTLRIPDAAEMRRAVVPPSRAAAVPAAAVSPTPKPVEPERPAASQAPAKAESAPPAAEPRLAIVQPAVTPGEAGKPAAPVVTAPMVGEVVKSAPVETGAAGGVAPGTSAALVEQFEALKVENEGLNERLARLESQLGKMEELLRLKDLQIKELEKRPAPASTVTAEGGAPAAPAVKTPAPQAAEAEPEAGTLMDALTNPVVLGAGGVGALLVALLLGRLRRRREQDASQAQPVVPEVATVAGAGAAAATAAELMPVVESQEPPAPEAQAAEAMATAADPLREALEEADVMVAYGLHDRALRILDDAMILMPDAGELLARKVRLFHEMGAGDEFLKAAEDYRARFPAEDDAHWAGIQAIGEASYADAPLFGGEMVGTPEPSASPEAPALEWGAFEARQTEPVREVPEVEPEVSTPEPSLSFEALEFPSMDEASRELPQATEEPARLASAVEEVQAESLELPPLELHLPELEPETAATPEALAAGEPEASAPLESIEPLEELELGLPEPTSTAGAAEPAAEAAAPGAISDEDLLLLGLDADSLSGFDASAFASPEPEPASVTPMPLEAPVVQEESGQAESLAPVQVEEPPVAPLASLAAAEAAQPEAATVRAAFDELGAKLDIAQAFIDMGDHASARTLLEEVIRDGEGGFQARARELLDQLQD